MNACKLNVCMYFIFADASVLYIYIHENEFSLFLHNFPYKENNETNSG